MTAHTYTTNLVWEGSTGAGYRAYSRLHRAVATPAAEITLSADPHFRGDSQFINPEQLLVMAASSCLLLSFLAVAARNHIDVVNYADEARGFMSEDVLPMSVGRIELSPVVSVAPGTNHDLVHSLIERAHEECYISNSLTSTVSINASVVDA
jgi:organic hydroperoxide reductase OsmC/OhrA